MKASTLEEMAIERNQQRDFLIGFEKQLGINKPIWIDRNLVEWKRIEQEVGIKIWEVAESKLVSAAEIRSNNIIGRYRINPQNSEGTWELWFDIESNRHLTTQSEIQQHFNDLKQATLKVLSVLSWFGIPKDCIFIKSSGRGVHIHVFVKGIRDRVQYQAIMEAIIDKTELPNIKSREYAHLDMVVFGVDRASLKTVTKIREFGAVNDKVQGCFVYTTHIPYDGFLKLKKYPFVFDPDKVEYPSIKTFVVDKPFIRKLHEANTESITTPFKDPTEKVIYDLDGDPRELYNCPLIKSLSEKAKEQHHLTNIERVFLSQTFPFFGERGEKELQDVLSNCEDYDEAYSQYQINSMKRNNRKPITCEWARKNVECPTECKGSTGKGPIKFAWKTLSLEELKATFTRHLCFTTEDSMEDTEVIDILLATSCDRKKQGDSIWLFLVAPAGGTKTELLRSLSDWEIYGLDTLTPQTLISGMVKYVEGEPRPAAGIMEQLEGKILVIKDFTLVLTKNADTRNAIFGVLRNAYDGYLEAAYGTLGEKVVKKAKFGVIAGVTPIIDNYHTLLVLLGERFLKIRHNIDKRKATEKALANQGKEARIRRELKQTVYRFLKNIDFSTEVEICTEYNKHLVDLAMFVAKVRTPVWTSETSAYQEFDFMATTEYATRLVKQLVKLLVLLTIIRGRTQATKEDLATVIRVGFDTLPQDRLEIIRYLYINGASHVLPISQAIKLDNKTTTRKLYQMLAIGDIVKPPEVELEGKWQLHNSIISFLDGLSNIGIKRIGYVSPLSNNGDKGEETPTLSLPSNPNVAEAKEDWLEKRLEQN